MNKIHCNRQQNNEHDTYGSEYSPANVFAHWLPVGVILYHYSHRHEQVNHHEYKQTNQNYLNDHNVSLKDRKRHSNRFTSRRWIAIAVTLLAVGLMFRLGFWQLDRMHQKEARLASIAQKQVNGPISLFELPATASSVQDYPVSFSGTIDPTPRFFLDNQTHDGQVGYHLLAPVRTESGNVLVNFGWVPAGQYRGVFPSTSLPIKQTSFAGTISTPTINPVVRETATEYTGHEVLIQQIDITTLNEQTGLQLKPFIVQLERPTDNQFQRDWQPVVMPPKKHLAYAVQWFGLALAASIVAFIVFFPRGNSNDKPNTY